MNWHLLLVFESMKYHKFVQEDVDFFAVVDNVEQQLFLGIRDEGISNVAYPEDGWLAIRILWQIVEMNGHVEGDETNGSLLRIGEVV